MQNRIDIDQTHSRAIGNEIGEQLRLLIGQERELPANLTAQMSRLRELEGPIALHHPRSKLPGA
jgi:hypothetical protein